MRVCGQGHTKTQTPAGVWRCRVCDRETERRSFRNRSAGLVAERRMRREWRELNREGTVRLIQGSGRWERVEQCIARGWPLERIAAHVNVRDEDVYLVADRMDEAVRG